MSTVFSTNVPFPPAGTQIRTGSGTLLSAGVRLPSGLNNGATDMYGIDCTFYDSATGGLDLSTPLVALKGRSGSGPMSAAFTKGLYIVQRSHSSIDVVWQ
ncbi:hypothetical protein [Caballeronia sordidicola]|uniref:hypothetical protein n=1 Tax=Caballeronia sordidicola TaxID=196367 RepID=UPI000A3BEC8B|nr:hypothetical protein [Caballeronia sordidicola]